MIKHKFVKNGKLSVSNTLHESGALNLDEDGIIQEELTDEQITRLKEHPDFEEMKEQQGAGKTETAAQKKAREKKEKLEAEAKAKAEMEGAQNNDAANS